MSDEAKLFQRALWIVAAITLVRVAVLIVSPLELYPDEAQYWWWAQTPDLGYFSKPPLIAWIVAATTAAFGNAEWVIRLASPLLHAGTALLMFGIAKLTFNARTGFWSGLAYLTLPGVSYSCGLISTDVPLLFCWALALYAFLRAARDPGWRWPILCGLALGLGLLAKYAMLYFVLGAVAAALMVPEFRKLVFHWRGLAILLIGLALLAPNLIWNAVHGFPTVSHTEANADWGRAHFELSHLFDFVWSQFGVFGPLLMLGYGLALWGLARGRNRNGRAFALAAFSVPIVVLIAIQAFISQANANWAATAYIAATPLAVFMLLHHYRRMVLWVSFAFNGLVMAVLWAILVAPPVADAMGVGNALKREEGWRPMATAVAAQAGREPYAAVVAANRSVIAELLYYGHAMKTPVRMWDRDLHDDDHFEMTMRLHRASGRFLLVLEASEPRFVPETFASATRIAAVVIPVGGGRTRTTVLLDANNYLGPQLAR